MSETGPPAGSPSQPPGGSCRPSSSTSAMTRSPLSAKRPASSKHPCTHKPPSCPQSPGLTQGSRVVTGVGYSPVAPVSSPYEQHYPRPRSCTGFRTPPSTRSSPLSTPHPGVSPTQSRVGSARSPRRDSPSRNFGVEDLRWDHVVEKYGRSPGPEYDGRGADFESTHHTSPRVVIPRAQAHPDPTSPGPGLMVAYCWHSQSLYKDRRMRTM